MTNIYLRTPEAAPNNIRLGDPAIPLLLALPPVLRGGFVEELNWPGGAMAASIADLVDAVVSFLPQGVPLAPLPEVTLPPFLHGGFVEELPNWPDGAMAGSTTNAAGTAASFLPAGIPLSSPVVPPAVTVAEWLTRHRRRTRR
jgi:hypothetical protein